MFQAQRTAQKLVDPLAGFFLPSEIYEEGTYVPTYLGATTPGTTTYSIQVGRYLRLGSLVYFRGRVDWTAATGTGTAQVSLPFTTVNDTSGHGAISLYTINVTFANGSVQGIVAPNVAFFTMLSPATNAAGTVVAMEAAGTIIFSGRQFIG